MSVRFPAPVPSGSRIRLRAGVQSAKEVEGAIEIVWDVKDGGGKVLNGPHQIPGGSWIVQCVDPLGAMFAMVAPKH